MGKRRSGRYVIWRITVPEHLAVETELRLVDPIRGKPTYGARAQLVEALLVAHLAKLKELENAGINPANRPTPQGQTLDQPEHQHGRPASPPSSVEGAAGSSLEGTAGSGRGSADGGRDAPAAPDEHGTGEAPVVKPPII